MKWYKYDIRNFTQEEYEKWYSLMSKERQKKVDSLKLDDDKKRTVAGEMLVKKELARLIEIVPEKISIYNDKNGKPYAENCGLEFNISHSENIAVCAIDKNKIGIDVEKIRPINLKVAKRICNTDELNYLFGFSPTDNDFKYTEEIEILSRFFEIWTGKEAYGKCMGTGLKDLIKLPFNKIDFFQITDGYALSIKTY